jgi:hypothetical protein
MIGFKEIASARYSGDRATLFESSLGRVWQHVQDAPNRSFAIITSWRQENSRKQNKEDLAALKKGIRGLGLGFVSVQGHWQECQDPNVAYQDCPKEELVDAVEPSLFVVGIDKDAAVNLANTYEQDAIVFAGPETKGRVSLLFNNGSTQDIGEFKPQTMGQAFTELRKSKQGSARHFKFEGIEYAPQGYVESLIEEEVRKVFEERTKKKKKP